VPTTIVLVAELADHARLDTLRVYSQPTAAGKLNTLRHLPYSSPRSPPGAAPR
jgi:hypothetical protein